MHYYQHNIGDYRRDTGHLSLLEHGVYRQLLDMYYLSEDKIPEETEVVYRRLSARTEDEKRAVDTVLSEFFRRDSGWVHTRCDKEITEYQGKADRARNNGKLGGRPSRTKVVISGNQDETQTKANQETHKPRNPETKDKEPRKARRQPEGCLSVNHLVADGVDPQIAKDWLQVRKDKGAKTLTQTAWDGVKTEAIKAGLTNCQAVKESAERGWQGFKASWLTNGGARHGPPMRPPSAAEMRLYRSSPQIMDREVFLRCQAYAGETSQTIEMEPTNANAITLGR